MITGFICKLSFFPLILETTESILNFFAEENLQHDSRLKIAYFSSVLVFILLLPAVTFIHFSNVTEFNTEKKQLNE